MGIRGGRGSEGEGENEPSAVPAVRRGGVNGGHTGGRNRQRRSLEVAPGTHRGRERAGAGHGPKRRVGGGAGFGPGVRRGEDIPPTANSPVVPWPDARDGKRSH